MTEAITDTQARVARSAIVSKYLDSIRSATQNAKRVMAQYHLSAAYHKSRRQKGYDWAASMADAIRVGSMRNGVPSGTVRFNGPKPQLFCMSLVDCSEESPHNPLAVATAVYFDRGRNRVEGPCTYISEHVIERLIKRVGTLRGPEVMSEIFAPAVGVNLSALDLYETTSGDLHEEGQDLATRTPNGFAAVLALGDMDYVFKTWIPADGRQSGKWKELDAQGWHAFRKKGRMDDGTRCTIRLNPDGNILRAKDVDDWRNYA